jgi:uncharacterized protein YjbI with pentapeptide repeats
MPLPIPLPRNYSEITPSQFFEAAKQRGIGRTNTAQKPASPWTTEEICEALRHFYRNDPAKSVLAYTGTVNGWSKGQIPKQHRRAFLSIFTPEHRLENWQEWRDAFIDCWNTHKRNKKPPEVNARTTSIGFDLGNHTPSRLKLNELVQQVIQEWWPNLDLPNLSDLSLNVLTHRVLARLAESHEEAANSVEQINFQLLYYTGLDTMTGMALKIAHYGKSSNLPANDICWEDYARYLIEDHPPLTSDNLSDLANLGAVRYLCGKMRDVYPDAAFSCKIFTRSFIDAFYSTWRKYNSNSQRYIAHLHSLAEDIERVTADLALRSHRQAIAEEARAPMFSNVHGQSGEPFSLQDIYVDLPLLSELYDKGCRSTQSDIDKRIDAHDLIAGHITNTWINQPNSNNFLIIRGSPGAGKSSILREQLRRIIAGPVFDNLAVIFIPLQRHGPFENFDQSLVLRGATLPGFPLQQTGLDVLDIFEKSSFKQLLVVFDGLDELGRQDNKIEDIERLSRVLELTDKAPKRKPVKYILAGRDQPFRHLDYPPDQDQHTYRLLGLSEDVVEVARPGPLISDEHIHFAYDYRCEWLAKYSQFKFFDPSPKRPELFHSTLHPLYELTREPLLLFLLCRLASLVADQEDSSSETGDRVLDLDRVYDLNDEARLNKNDIFQILIKSIRHSPHRNKAHHERPERMGGIPEQHFENILTCLAMPAWRNHTGRRATVRAFLEEAKRENLEVQAGKLVTIARGETAASTDPVHLGLLSVFYFRAYRSNTTNIDEFEFTHKSFASYLVAARMFRAAIDLILDIHSPNPKLNLHELLQNWIDLTINGEETLEIHLFISDEAHRYLRGNDALPSVFGQLAKGIGQYPGDQKAKIRPECFETTAANMFWRSYRCEGDDGALISPLFPAFLTQRRTFRMFFNIFGALVNAYGDLNGERYKPVSADFAEILRAANEPARASDLEGIEYGQTDFLASSLRWFDLSGLKLTGLNLSNGDFAFSDLTDVQFHATILNHAVFHESKLEQVDFIDCQLSNSLFAENTDFSFFDCIAREARFNKCLFQNSLFARSDFSGSTFENCRFESCHFELTSLDDCKFKDCIFDDCVFICCTLRETELEGGVFENACFKYSHTKKLSISKKTKFNEVTGFNKNN